MTETDPAAEARFIDRSAWLPAFFSLIFLITHPLAIIAMWLEPRGIASWKYLIPFAAIFVLVAPVLVRSVLNARTREIRVNGQNGMITIRIKRPFRISMKHFAPDAVTGLVFETTRDDGNWYRALLELRNSRRIEFARGNHEAIVRAEMARMAASLAATKPDLLIREIGG